MKINYDFYQKMCYSLGVGGFQQQLHFKLAKQAIKSIYLFDLDSTKTNSLLLKLQTSFSDLLIHNVQVLDRHTVSAIDVIYNGTGVGKISNDNHDSAKSLSNLLIPSNILVIDANYTPWKTQFIKLCEKKYKSLNGFPHMIAFTAPPLIYTQQNVWI
jgi:shikimate 5-dehydrogenase